MAIIIKNINYSNRRRKRQTFGNILQPNDFTDSLQNVDLTTFLTPNAFDVDPTCDDSGPCDETSPFRSFSGHCNNLRSPNWGKSLTTFARLLPSQYEDGNVRNILRNLIVFNVVYF